MLAQPVLKRPAVDSLEASPSKRLHQALYELDDLAISEDILSPAHSISEAPSTPRTPRSSSTVSRPKIYDCPYDGCGKSFNRPCRLSDHIRTHTNERSHACPYDGCDKTFFRDTHLNRHIKSAHKQEHNYPCSWDGCGKRFNTGTRLRRHLKTHEDAPFRCTDYPPCADTFRKHATLAAHVSEAHLGRKAYPCPHVDPATAAPCPRGYDTAAKLKAHVAAHHVPGTAHRCPTCPDDAAAFPTHRALQAHLRTAHPPQCPYCAAPIRRAPALRAHVELHHPEAPEAPEPGECGHPCGVAGCGRAFTRPGILAEHKRLEHRKGGRRRGGEGEGMEGVERRGREVYVAGRKARRSDAVMRVTGAGYEESGREVGCPMAGCGWRFFNGNALAGHLEGLHGMGGREAAEVALEREAAVGGRFWVGGGLETVDEEEEEEEEEQDNREPDRQMRIDEGMERVEVRSGATVSEELIDPMILG